MGRVLLAVYNDWSEMMRNMTKARAVWQKMLMILIREGARPRVSGFLFKAIVQSVLLFRGETWVVTPRMGWVLGGFQYQVARKLTGWIPHQGLDGRWEYNLTKAAREEVGFEPMETYIQRRQNTVMQYIATRPILDLCEAAERKRGRMGGDAVLGTGGN